MRNGPIPIDPPQIITELYPYTTRVRLPANLQFKYNGKDIEIVKDFNYLGIYFSRSGSFKTM